MMTGLEIEPRPHRWEVSVLTTTLYLHLLYNITIISNTCNQIMTSKIRELHPMYYNIIYNFHGYDILFFLGGKL